MPNAHPQHSACQIVTASPSYMRAYHRRRTAAACTAIRAAATSCQRQRIHPDTSPDAADQALAVAWVQHLGFTNWQERDQ